MARYIVTGATGHIGNNVLRALNAAHPEAEIVALLRRAGGAALADVPHTEVIGDLFDETFLRSVIHPGDRVIHAAGFIDLTDRHPEETYRVNVELTRRIFTVSQHTGVAKFVYLGSVDGIPKENTAAPIAEPADDAWDDARVEGHYGKSKARAAAFLLSENAAAPLPTAVLLPSAVIGPYDYKPSAVGGILASALAGKAELGLPGGYNFVDVRDVAAAVVRAADGDFTGSAILSGENVTVGDLYTQLNATAGLRQRPRILPLWLVRLCLPFIPQLNKITLKALTDPHDYTCARARAALGFAPRPFADTLRDTVAWFRSQDQ